MPVEEANPVTRPILSQLQIEHEQLAVLPPELRDKLLALIATWGEPAEQLELAERLREFHGPLLFLLDYQAQAAFRAGDFSAALNVLERRQRRSTTIASQALEAEVLLAAGYEAHAEAVATDISHAHANDIVAVRAAARVYQGLGRGALAGELTDAYLGRRPHHILGTLTAAEIAHENGDPARALEFVQRLGAGIPAGISNHELMLLADLVEALDYRESAQAARAELERRRHFLLQELHTALAPYRMGEDAELQSPQELYRNLKGADMITVERREARNIKLEAVRHFGFMELRYGQIEVIATVLRAQSILTVMPTGAGKSLCYQLPALMLPKPTLVISPLIALMKDQVEGLPATARRQATFINSTLSDEELDARMRGIANGDYKLIYAAPERLRQRAFLRALRSAGLGLFVIDEAHCVSLWGHDFRPDYLFVQEARHELGNPPSLAMTATAPPRVRDEIVDYLTNVMDGAPDDEAQAGHPTPDGLAATARIHRPQVMALDIFRSNLHLSAIRFHNEEEKLAALIKFVTETEGSGIVYVNSRHKAEGLAYALRGEGVAAEAYHAGLAERGAVQDRFMADKTRVVVATVAFGMGIDKSDIRFIVHFHPPRSLAAYYQEVGRAGRDSKPSQGVLFFSNNDWANLRRWAKSDEMSIDFLVKVYVAVANQLGVKLDLEQVDPAQIAPDEFEQAEADGEPNPVATVPASPDDESGVISGAVDARRLQQVLNSDETTIRVAVSLLERADLLSRSFDVPREVDIGLTAAGAREGSGHELEFRRLRAGLSLRKGRSAAFQLTDVANFMGRPLDITETELMNWADQGLLTVKGSRRSMFVELAPSPSNLRERLERLINQSSALGQRRIDDVIGYATAETCRHGYISMHFGSPPRNQCDVCDNCTGIRPEMPLITHVPSPLPDDGDIEPMILDCLVSLPKPVGRSGLARILAGSLRAPVKPHQARHHGRLKEMGEAMVMNVIDDLLEGNRLRQYERSGYPVLAATVRGRSEAEAWLAENPTLNVYAEEPLLEEITEPAAPAEGDKYTALQKALWLWRRRTADEQGQPPYVIMSNELMLKIAESRPATLDDLALIPGMGVQRLQHYGPMILDLIQLNGAHAGDDDLLEAQRAVQASGEETVRKQINQAQQAISPRQERQIFLRMQEMRQKIAVSTGEPAYQVATNGLLRAIAKSAPSSREALEAVLGFRSSGLSKHADDILAAVAEQLNAS